MLLKALLTLREALARGETPENMGICSFVGGHISLNATRAYTLLKPHWQNWPELDPELPPEWPVAGRPSILRWHEAGEDDPQRRWTNPRRLSLLNHLIQELSKDGYE